jgi:hypothetical protein
MAMKRLISILALAAAAGCGGDDSDNIDQEANAGFVVPTEPTFAFTQNEGVWELQGPADWSCLNTPTEDAPTSVEVQLSGAVEDFQTEEALPGATITAYNDTNFQSAGVATATSNEDGNYSITLPVGGTRWGFKVTLEDALETYLLNQYYQPDVVDQTETMNSVSLLTAQALPAFIGVTRTPGLGILAGAIRDCNLNEVAGAIATVSAVPGAPMHLDGAETYYFSALSTSLPVRHSQQLNTNSDGLFVVIELPPSGESYLQVWGFVDDADMADGEMTLLGEIPSPVLSDSVITAGMEALRE